MNNFYDFDGLHCSEAIKNMDKSNPYYEVLENLEYLLYTYTNKVSYYNKPEDYKKLRVLKEISHEYTVIEEKKINGRYAKCFERVEIPAEVCEKIKKLYEIAFAENEAEKENMYGSREERNLIAAEIKRMEEEAKRREEEAWKAKFKPDKVSEMMDSIDDVFEAPRGL
jgi:hypothetical protein